MTSLNDRDFIASIRRFWDFLSLIGLEETFSNPTSLKASDEFLAVIFDSSASYEAVYLTALRNSDYNLMLRDHSFFQFTHSLSGWRLAYYPNPFFGASTPHSQKFRNFAITSKRVQSQSKSFYIDCRSCDPQFRRLSFGMSGHPMTTSICSILLLICTSAFTQTIAGRLQGYCPRKPLGCSSSSFTIGARGILTLGALLVGTSAAWIKFIRHVAHQLFWFRRIEYPLKNSHSFILPSRPQLPYGLQILSTSVRCGFRAFLILGGHYPTEIARGIRPFVDLLLTRRCERKSRPLGRLLCVRNCGENWLRG